MKEQAPAIDRQGRILSCSQKMVRRGGHTEIGIVCTTAHHATKGEPTLPRPHQQSGTIGRVCCRFDGCAKWAALEGICISHGAKVKRCSHEECANRSVKGGVCIAHGAKVRCCGYKGCTNRVVRAGVCYRHGAKTRCSHEGCTNNAKRGGVCITHGAKTTRCSVEGCGKHTVRGGVCIRHGAKVRCTHVGCAKHIRKGGLCKRHGEMARCGHEGSPIAFRRVDPVTGMVRTAAVRDARTRPSREEVARGTTARGLSPPPRAKRSAPPPRPSAKSEDGEMGSSAVKKDAKKEEHITQRAGSAAKTVELGNIGCEFRKEFNSGWFVGRVIEIRPYAGE
jgi:hypothetical protein